MLDSFKAVLEMEREAEHILDTARKKAKKIEIGAQEKAELVYRQTFQETKEKAKKEAESEAQFFVKNAETLKKKIEKGARQNFDDAVDEVLKEILL